MTTYISYAELPTASPLSGTEILAVSQSGESVQTTLSDVLAILGTNYGTDTGTVNIVEVMYTPGIFTLVDGLQLRFLGSNTNTGATTFSPNGLAAAPILGAAHLALEGGEIIADGDNEVIWNAALSSWILTESTGGAQQVGNATKPNQAVALNQLPYASSTWVPTITSGTGALTTTVVDIAVYYTLAKLVYFTVQVTITANGTGATNIEISLPITPSINPFFVNGLATTSGTQLVGNYLGTGANITIVNYDGTYPATDGETISVSGWYESES